VGFPIRTSMDQSLFAAPHGFSQRTTSFIASRCQGIHQMLLRHLITLIIDTHPRLAADAVATRRHGARSEAHPVQQGTGGSIRKDQFHEICPLMRQLGATGWVLNDPPRVAEDRRNDPMSEITPSVRTAPTVREGRQRHAADPALGRHGRTNLLFTMSDF
jgi:hypothetical protein